MSGDTGDISGDNAGTLGTATLSELGTLGTNPLEGLSLSPGGNCPRTRFGLTVAHVSRLKRTLAMRCEHSYSEGRGP